MEKTEIRSNKDRRDGAERRSSIDMRTIDVRIEQGERRSGKDKRSGKERRSD